VVANGGGGGGGGGGAVEWKGQKILQQKRIFLKKKN
jgi:hypothetical protein